MSLRIGEARDVLVAVQADSTSSLDRLRTLFESWLEPEFADAPPVIRPAFSVRLEPVPDRDRQRTGGPRPVPQLRYGSTVIARSRRPDDIVRALAQVLGGAHQRHRDDGRLWIDMRPFVNGRSMVLVDAEPPALVNDRRLATTGIEELTAWSVIIDDDGSVSVPPPLPHLAWNSIGIEPQVCESRHFQLAGMLVLNEGQPTEAEIAVILARHSLQNRWATVIEALADAGSLLSAVDHRGLRCHIAALLDGAGAS